MKKRKLITILIIIVLGIFLIPNQVYATEYVTFSVEKTNGAYIWNDISGTSKQKYESVLSSTGTVTMLTSDQTKTVYANWTNHNLIGWSENSSCTSYYSPGETVTGVTPNTTFYACWDNASGTTSSTGTCSEECNDIAPAVRIIKYGLIPLFQIGIPIVLIVMGMIDLAKAVMASKEDEMKKAQSIFIKRCIYGVAVFFVITIVTIVFKLFAISGADEEVKGTDDWLSCYNAVGLTEDDCEN